MSERTEAREARDRLRDSAPLFEPDDAGTRWRISGAWARRHLDCTLEGITRDGGCGGACCRKQAFWPPRAGTVPDACDHLGPDGCRLGDARPATCHLYPMKLNPSGGTLVGHHVGLTLKHSVCEPCRDRGPMIVDAIAGSLAVLFGDEQAARIVADVHAGRDSHVDVAPGTLAAMLVEEAWEANDVVPEPRDWEALR
jgi:hypothetical protein